MKKPFYVYWWKLKEGCGNFGDELNQYIIESLVGFNVNRIIIPSSGFDYILRALRLIYHKAIPFKDIISLIKQFFINDFIVGIGSILQILNSPNCKVWGAGIINSNAEINPASFYAVRGKYTQKRLKELNLPVPETIGDPALLLPIIYNSNPPRKYKLGIIPHFMHYNSIKEKVNIDSVIVINLKEDIEEIIDQILSCEHTISTSLHGIIVSQAYGIPSLWYTYAEKLLGGDNIKFYDYFSSVGIDEYLPFNLLPEDIKLNEINKLFNDYQDLTLIKKPLSEIQKKLITAAPFDVLEKYKSAI